MHEKENIYGIIRIIAALLVVVHHTFGLLQGAYTDSPFVLATQKIDLGNLGVSIFFAVSGYLIAKSRLANTRSTFVKKRIARILPGLTVSLLLVCFFVLPFFYIKPAFTIFTDYNFWHYFGSNIWIFFSVQQLTLPGVFTNSSFPDVPNASLWTLPLEVGMYFLIFLLPVRFFRICIVVALFVFTTLVALYITKNETILTFVFALSGPFETLYRAYFLLYGTVFLIGSVLAVFSHHLKSHHLFTLIALLSILALFVQYSSGYIVLWYTVLPLIVIALAQIKPHKIIENIQQLGDPSYGIYIYSFPIQQVILHTYVGNNVRLSSTLFLTLSVVVSIALGYFSWHFVEKKCLKLNMFAKS